MRASRSLRLKVTEARLYARALLGVEAVCFGAVGVTKRDLAQRGAGRVEHFELDVRALRYGQPTARDVRRAQMHVRSPSSPIVSQSEPRRSASGPRSPR